MTYVNEVSISNCFYGKMYDLNGKAINVLQVYKIPLLAPVLPGLLYKSIVYVCTYNVCQTLSVCLNVSNVCFINCYQFYHCENICLFFCVSVFITLTQERLDRIWWKSEGQVGHIIFFSSSRLRKAETPKRYYMYNEVPDFWIKNEVA